MSTQSTTNDIRTALSAAAAGDFPELATTLLAALGYNSERTLAGQTGKPGDFIRQFPAQNPGTQWERSFLDNAQSVRILFQFTGSEIQAQTQRELFAATDLDTGNARSFLFAAVELNGNSYPRGQYAIFTRELNKHFQLPMVVLFRTADNRITLAFVHRRPNKRDPNRDVLGSVSLIREIDPESPHRAHLDILAELSLPERLRWMDSHGKTHNFDGLLDAWLDALDTEELNRRFYRDLFAWFEQAVNTAKFPAGEAKTLPTEEHVIRLITRLMFVWFIKEKGLVAGDLFIENRAAQLLKDYDQEGGDSYYRAVLQNLFFATLNTEIDQRGFSSENDDNNSDFSRYRYHKEIADADALLALFDKTPFINGGLFDCLDSFDATSNGGYRIDCFSDVHYRKLSIPNRLFFSADDRSPGLIDLFNRYKFTVEENTPAEREVALDPELLGKVFENLLAAFNPETRENVRKQTGSYYTPRAVVDYMVDEALIATLAQRVAPADGDVDFWQERLRCLVDYDDAFADAEELFTPLEREAVVRAIAETKALDPAVGSGAFPMGILHKLTLALRRLDGDNELWRELQREIATKRAANAFGTDDQQERDAELAEISDTFQRYSNDFGRKLYLIQNSIYGVDIQPVATQIAKLRFFISLAIEQEPTYDAAENYGVKPLPNLETRFVAADTLLGLSPLAQLRLGQTDAVKELQRKLDANRERHFNASTRQRKLYYRQEDERLRKELAAALRQADFSAGDANKIAAWDPYDQNASSDWFDPEYMFGVANGFDVVIGNPPYVRPEGSDEKREIRNRIVNSNQYETLYEKWDLYIPFIERGYKLLKPGGFTTMIVSDAYCHARYARRSQDWFLAKSRIVRLDFFGKIQIFEAGVRNIVYLFQKSDGQHNKPERRVHNPEFGIVELLPTNEQRNLSHRVFFPEDAQLQEVSASTVRLAEICYISYGLRPSSKPGARETFVTDDITSEVQDKVHPKRYVDGKHLDAWLPNTHLWIEWGTERSPKQFYAPTFSELHDAKEKILAKKNCGPNPVACYDDRKLVFSASAIGLLTWESLSGVRNNSIKKQARYRNEKQIRNLPNREALEQISKHFSLRFLLGVLNSSFVSNFLKVNRRHNISLYPDDWKSIPIPDIGLEQQAPIVRVVDRILAAKAAALSADTRADESEIDRLVYALYGLKEAEVAAVEGRE